MRIQRIATWILCGVICFSYKKHFFIKACSKYDIVPNFVLVLFTCILGKNGLKPDTLGKNSIKARAQWLGVNPLRLCLFSYFCNLLDVNCNCFLGLKRFLLSKVCSPPAVCWLMVVCICKIQIIKVTISSA